jgi:hypothetical protein
MTHRRELSVKAMENPHGRTDDDQGTYGGNVHLKQSGAEAKARWKTH